MLALERADELRAEADLVLGLVRLYDVLCPYGEVFPGGSYYLDVMVYPDIDLYITRVSLSDLFEIGAHFAASELVIQVVFEKSDDPLLLPDGLYCKLRINYGNWGRPWKIDLWSLDAEIIARNMAEIHHFKNAMTPELRDQIVRYKLSLLNSEKRTPKYSGYYIYKAFIDEGLLEPKDVTQYLLRCGVQMDEKYFRMQPKNGLL
jgi:hypothetical protein